MSAPLTSVRKRELAAGLMWIAAALLLMRGGWIAWKLLATRPELAGLMLGVHALGSAMGAGAARACTRSPRWAYALTGLFAAFWMALFLPQLEVLAAHGLALMGRIAAQMLPLWACLLAVALLRSSAHSDHAPRRAAWLRGLRAMGGMLLFLATLEVGMRQLGMRPETLLYNPHFHAVETLEVSHPMATDSAGICVIHPEARTRIEAMLAGDPQAQDQLPEDFLGDPNMLLQDQRRLLRGEVTNAYTQWLARLRTLPPDSLDGVDSAVMAQVRHPLNEDGFRSIPFQNHRTRKPKVLLLGDSFTWGHSASHLSNSFGDLLLTHGLAVYNSGISTTDPAQYAAIAQRYVPVIQPDVVVVNLYLGNDVKDFIRPIEPWHEFHYATNSGTLMAYPGPEWLPSPTAAYDFVLEEHQRMLPKQRILDRVCSYTILGTLTWHLLSNLHIIPFIRPNAAYWERCVPRIQTQPTTPHHLSLIQEACAAQGAKLIVAIIPAAPATPQALQAQHAAVWQGFQPLIPDNLTPADYHPEDGHFVDSGHRKYADMLHKAILAAVNGSE